METLSTKIHVAKKDHRCNYCGQKIISGVKYQSSSHVYDGDFYVWKAHLDCQEIATALNMYDWCDEGLDADSFREFIDVDFYKIMSETQNELYESKDYKIPDFPERLAFVKQHHLTLKTK